MPTRFHEGMLEEHSGHLLRSALLENPGVQTSLQGAVRKEVRVGRLQVVRACLQGGDGGHQEGCKDEDRGVREKNQGRSRIQTDGP